MRELLRTLSFAASFLCPLVNSHRKDRNSFSKKDNAEKERVCSHRIV